ncbi:U3 small nucleolar RNA-associated protein 6 homolog [Scaptodrosophila lebanonensis]|uniref:U3 small nucleolar RNA-associated protein 6 homolog n=1 Tax=Drosophila lebanonensis TaxID=7225 RepID=A0A6J2TU25_DROLE|nr:U3 small nucleolar RNA-associated protein 6 homolog [Scaptodrosophila lebanonensis]
MSEFVNERQERLLPEYEQLRNCNILTPQQITECIRKRESLFVGLSQSKASVKNYIEFLVYEKKIYKLITEKEKVCNIKMPGVKSAIATRLIRLYREALSKFPHDMHLWSSFVKYMKISKPEEVSAIYEKMLSYHGDKCSVWVDAALWLYGYHRQNVSRAQDLLLRGLQRHPESEALNQCLFDILLDQATRTDYNLRLKDNTISELDIALERIEAVYRNSSQNIKDINYYISLLDACTEQMDLTVPLQVKIIEDMQAKFPLEPVLWDKLAQRELQGHHLADLREFVIFHNQEAQEIEAHREAADKKAMACVSSTTDPSDGENEKKLDVCTIKKRRQQFSTIWTPSSLKRRIELCVSVYKTAVQTLNSKEMWDLYINAMLKLNKDASEMGKLKQESLMSAFHSGHKAKLLDVQHYEVLYKILVAKKGGEKSLVQVLSEILEYNESFRINELLLCVLIRLDDEPRVFELLQRAYKSLGDESVPLWKRVISYYRHRSGSKSMKRLEQIFEIGCNDLSPKFAQFRFEYVSYLWQEHSPAKARQEYQRLALLPPMSLTLHSQMVDLESKSVPIDVNSCRLCFEYMTKFFGKTEPSVWIDFIAFERDHGDAQKMPLLTLRAVSTLDPSLVSTFEVKRVKMHSGIMDST